MLTRSRCWHTTGRLTPLRSPLSVGPIGPDDGHPDRGGRPDHSAPGAGASAAHATWDGRGGRACRCGRRDSRSRLPGGTSAGERLPPGKGISHLPAVGVLPENQLDIALQTCDGWIGKVVTSFGGPSPPAKTLKEVVGHAALLV